MVNTDFLKDPLFQESYNLGVSTLNVLDKDLRHNFVYDYWRVYIACWSARHVLAMPGDFVECGVNTGFLSRAILNYTNFSKHSQKKFWLLDTWTGIVGDQLSDLERQLGREFVNSSHYTSNIYNKVKQTFEAFDNVYLIQGMVPETLEKVRSDSISYLSLDMNCAEPEVAALDFFWDKLLPGAIVLLDDYGFSENDSGCIAQKKALDAFAYSKGFSILTLPSGQGFILKQGEKQAVEQRIFF